VFEAFDDPAMAAPRRTAQAATGGSRARRSRAGVGHLIGYARISTDDQNLAFQLDALTQAGCRRVFRDIGSGSLTHRP
jgi:predicted site-specific integrase-resolvase